ncbi:MAG: hypothetical protein U9N45_03970, partial [Gemmatimonadota bacterium]|nr:hypothetical protein [Gemmatimonadota bacterium]
MKKILKVAVREFLETVKTKTFIISILLTPVIIGLVIFISMRLQKKSFTGPRPDRHVAVMNH